MVTLLYRHLLATSPEYDADEWARCDALYAGGRKLLRNQAVLKQLFDQHNAETAEAYAERLARAFYIPYAGQLIDFIVAALFGEKLTLELEGGAAADAFYAGFQENVAGALGPKLDLRRQISPWKRTTESTSIRVRMPAPVEANAPIAVWSACVFRDRR